MITGKFRTEKSELGVDFQVQTHTASVSLNTNISKTKVTESIPPTEATAILIPKKFHPDTTFYKITASANKIHSNQFWYSKCSKKFEKKVIQK